MADRITLARQELARRELERREEKTAPLSYRGARIPTEAERVEFKEHPFRETGKIMAENLRTTIPALTGGAKTAANIGLMGLPEIASQKIMRKPFVSPEEQAAMPPDMKTSFEMAGYGVGVPGKIVSGASNLLGKIAPKAVGFIPTVARGTATGAVAGGAVLPTPTEAATLKDALDILGRRMKTGAIFGGILSGGIYAGTKGVGKISKYASDKTTKIREGYRGWRDSEYQKYDTGISNLPSENLDGSQVLTELEQRMLQRGIINPDGTMNKVLSQADQKLLKAYEKLSQKWATSNGQLTSKDIIEEYQLIKGKFSGKPSPTQLQNREAAQEIINSSKSQFKSGEWDKINKEYSVFKNKEEVLDKFVGVKETNPYLTGKGERFITRGMGATEESRKAAEIAKETTGQTLKGGKFLSFVNRAAQNKLLRYGLLGGGLLGGQAMLGKKRNP